MTKKIIAIVPAAGVGARAAVAPRGPVAHGATYSMALQEGGAGAPCPKQYRLLKDEPMLRWAVRALLADGRIEQVRVAVAPHDTWVERALSDLPRTVWRPCGGPNRAATVAAALRDAALHDDDWVLVHDAARPGLPAEALARLISSCLANGMGGLLAQPVADTVKRGCPMAHTDCLPASEGGRLDSAGQAAPVRPGCIPPAEQVLQDGEGRMVVDATLPRAALWLAQTPQMFPAGRLLAALEAAEAAGAAITDEASALERAGYRPCLVPGSMRNFKVTWPEDFELMEKWL